MKDDREEFENIIKDIVNNKTVQEMKNYRQHCNISCYEHCYRTAYYCYKFCKMMHWDYVAVTRAAMVHDLFLYDWRVKSDRKGLHAFTHPHTAYLNAAKLFDLNAKEKDIIEKHMWPVTLAFPKYKESYVLTLMDKFSATKESFEYVKECVKKNEVIKYAYVFLAFFTFSAYKHSKGLIAAIIKNVMLLFMGL